MCEFPFPITHGVHRNGNGNSLKKPEPTSLIFRAHAHGIPDRDLDALDRYWKVFPSVRQVLFESAGRSGYGRLKLPPGEVKGAIFSHAEFTSFNKEVTALFSRWRTENTQHLMGISKGDKPKALINELSERLLVTFSKAKLVDAYDVYQHLMDYWAATMQDDVYLIVHSGWLEASRPREVLPVKGKDGKTVWPETHDFVVQKRRFKSDLLPAALLVAHFYRAERSAIEALEVELSSLAQKLDELREEHGGEDGLLEEVVEGEGDKQKITAKAVKARLKALGQNEDDADERRALEEYSALLEKEAEAKGRLKTKRTAMDEELAGRYGKLTVNEVKSLVVEGKWLATLSSEVQTELDRVSHALTGRIRELAERYATPLPKLSGEVKALTTRVEAHLKAMGVSWA